MSVITLTGFSGERPRRSPYLLEAPEAQQAKNVRLTSGRLEPLYAPLSKGVNLGSADIASAYRMDDGAGNDYWLGWTYDTDVVKAPVPGDETDRVYFSGAEQEPRVTNFSMATGGTPYPDAWYRLGVTPPTVAPTVVSDASGAGTTEDRAYVYTFVTEWGEESAPSPASDIITGKVDDLWTISGMQAAPANSFVITAATWAAGVVTATVANTFGLRVGSYITISGSTPSTYNATSVQVLELTSTTLKYALANDPGVYAVGATVTLDAPHNLSNMKRRVYRSVTSGVDADYYFIAEVPVGTTSVQDDENTVLGEPLPTSDWLEPPVDLQGLRSHPSGALLGFRKNMVYVSEPMAPYAWPSAYQFVLNYDVVALGVIGTTIVVVTEAFPFIIAGLTPESMVIDRIDNQWPGVSKRAVVETAEGVIWPTTIGLVRYGPYGAEVLTAAYYTQREWKRLPYSEFEAVFYDDRYYAAYTDPDSGYKKALVFTVVEGGALYFVDIDVDVFFEDAENDVLYLIHEGNLFEWDADESLFLSQVWWSKRFLFPSPVSFAVAQVHGNYGVSAAESAAADAARAALQAEQQADITAKTTFGSFNAKSLNTFSLNGSSIKPLDLVGSSARLLVVDFFIDDELYFSTTTSSDRPFRLPAGRLYDTFALRVSGPVQIDSIRVATSMSELL